MTVRNLLKAIGEVVPDKQFVDKLLSVDRELSVLLSTFMCVCCWRIYSIPAPSGSEA